MRFINEIHQIDREQRDFFKRAYGLSDASPYEFDMVINCDYIPEPEWAADSVAVAFENKFGLRFEKARTNPVKMSCNDMLRKESRL